MKPGIYFGDCLRLMEDINDRSIDFILADLPFGTTKCKWDSLIDLKRLWGHYRRIAKPNAAIALFAQIPFTITLGASNTEWLRYEWIWEKTSATGHLNSKKMPMKAHESILIFYDKLPIYNPQKTSGHKRKVSSDIHKRNSKKGEVYNEYKNTSYDSTDRFPRDVIRFKTDKQKLALHPTQKPVSLCEYMIKTYTNEGALVLDNTAGSGSTGDACNNTNRNYILMDNDKINIEIMEKRLNTSAS